MEKFYTVNEFAELLRVHRATISKMIKEKRINPINTGSKKKPKYAIPEDDLLRLRAEAFEENKEE